MAAAVSRSELKLKFQRKFQLDGVVAETLLISGERRSLINLTYSVERTYKENERNDHPAAGRPSTRRNKLVLETIFDAWKNVIAGKRPKQHGGFRRRCYKKRKVSSRAWERHSRSSDGNKHASQRSSRIERLSARDWRHTARRSQFKSR